MMKKLAAAVLSAAVLVAPATAYADSADRSGIPQTAIDTRPSVFTEQEWLEELRTAQASGQPADLAADSLTEDGWREYYRLTRGDRGTVSASGGSIGYEFNVYENSLCKRNWWQCFIYKATSASTLAKTKARNHRFGSDYNNKKQGWRHQFWFARLYQQMGSSTAWKWANAHEGTDRSRDHQCDMENNRIGARIGYSARNVPGQAKESYTERKVDESIFTKRNYCRR